MTRELQELAIIEADAREEYARLCEQRVVEDDTFARVNATGFMVTVERYSIDRCEVKYCGNFGMAITRERFTIETAHLRRM